MPPPLNLPFGNVFLSLGGIELASFQSPFEEWLITSLLMKLEVLDNPNGSTHPVGQCTYPYGLKPLNNPIGSGEIYCPVP